MDLENLDPIFKPKNMVVVGVSTSPLIFLEQDIENVFLEKKEEIYKFISLF